MTTSGPRRQTLKLHDPGVIPYGQCPQHGTVQGVLACVRCGGRLHSQLEARKQRDLRGELDGHLPSR